MVEFISVLLTPKLTCKPSVFLKIIKEMTKNACKNEVSEHKVRK